MTAPRPDRTCFLTSWSHSTSLKTLLCGWNDGAVDVISPHNPRQRSSLLPPGGACIPVTALSIMPLSLLRQPGNQFLSDWGNDARESGCEGVGIGALALVGSANGTVALWPTTGSCRPLHVLLAHADEVVAVRTAMDAPPEVGLQPRRLANTAPSGNGDGTDSVGDGIGRALGGTGVGRAPCSERSSFFVVTAGASREVKVWGIDAAAHQDAPPLALGGYTIVGAGTDDRLTVMELLSERFMGCGFSSGAVEVWSVPFDCRGMVLATTHAAKEAFPWAHGAAVTSITVSIGLCDPVLGGGDGSAGRAVLTTSADRTVIRWACSAPGDNLRPLRRYCLSSEPTAAVVLPPASTTTRNRRCSPLSRGRTDHGNFSTTGIVAAGMFRVVAALNGVVAVLELATARDLIGSAVDLQGKLPFAVTNAFPGTPCLPMLPPAPHISALQTSAGQAVRWKVGGLKGREVGFYDVLGCMRALPKEWQESGMRRAASAAAARNAWEVDAQARLEEGGTAASAVQSEREEGNAIVERASFHRRNNKTKRGAKTQERGKIRNGRTIGISSTDDQSPGVNVKTLTLTMNAGDSSTDGGYTPAEDTFRGVDGGKTVKLDPKFAAASRSRVQSRLPVVENAGTGSNIAVESNDDTLPPSSPICTSTVRFPMVTNSCGFGPR